RQRLEDLEHITKKFNSHSPSTQHLHKKPSQLSCESNLNSAPPNLTYEQIRINQLRSLLNNVRGQGDPPNSNNNEIDNIDLPNIFAPYMLQNELNINLLKNRFSPNVLQHPIPISSNQSTFSNGLPQTNHLFISLVRIKNHMIIHIYHAVTALY
ncbi:40682_t:CDS:2, partial [Gigaspora margarita]